LIFQKEATIYMPLYKISKNELELITENNFKLEKDIKKPVEANLETIFGLKLVRSEFTLSNLRVDTLAYDKASKSFVVIEYKRDKNFSVIDQGMSYLGLMLNNKAEVILEYNEKCSASLKRDDVDWTQSKVIFISPTFTTFQLESINFKDLPIELWEVKRYSKNLIRFDQHEAVTTNATIKSVTKKSSTVRTITKEVKVYSEEDHLKIAKPDIKELYFKFKDSVLAISDTFTVKPMKQYIAFKTKTNVTDIVFHKSKMTIYLNIPKGKLDDPQHLAQDITEIGHWGNGDYRINLKSEDELEYVTSLVRQSYRINS
jgi:predicted transport protein